MSKKPKQIEMHYIVNIDDFEALIRDIRPCVVTLRKFIEEKDFEVAEHMVRKLDLKLHELEEFEFILERRTVRSKSAFEESPQGQVQLDYLEKLCAPISEYIRENCNPYTEITISGNQIIVNCQVIGIPLKEKGDQSMENGRLITRKNQMRR